MTKVKKQHFVSRFYLEYFTDLKGSIYVFDLQTMKSFGTSTENVAHRKYFYDYEPLDRLVGMEQTVEKALAKSEDGQSLVFKRLVEMLRDNDISSLTKEDYRTLADYIVTQQLRTPEKRIKGIQMATEVENQLREKGASDEFIKENGFESDKYDPQFQQIYGLLHSGVIDTIEDLCNRYWVFWSNKSKHNFYTSDHPVIGYLHNETAFEIYFPITPRHSVSIFMKDQFPNLAGHHRRINEIRDSEHVKFYNLRVLEQCNRQVYNSENDFRFAKKVVRENPILTDPNRQRIQRM